MVVEKVSATVSGVFSPVLVAGSRCNNTTPPSLSSPSSQSSASKLNDSKPSTRDKHTVSAVREAQYNTSTTNSISPSQQPFVMKRRYLLRTSKPFVLHYFSDCIEEFHILSVGASERQPHQAGKTSGFWPAGSSDKQIHCHQHIQTCWVCCYIELLLLLICACLWCCEGSPHL